MGERAEAVSRFLKHAEGGSCVTCGGYGGCGAMIADAGIVWLESPCECGAAGSDFEVEEGLFDLLAAELERLEAELERTRQAWVDGDDPECDDVCVVVCKGPCGGQDQ
ncbi:MAG: hypothetical protein GY701_13240 [Sulfitobacter sp.]|nr:hypothetical protein [Sulfitobacter sp.]